ncbi:inositol monophosphatase family protein [Sphingorhabdus lacus]|jgi:inositol-phosphate phosphatase / L-galactose 1-phosphate phosphatase / histidinol-phosphatase|uniref:Inositol monophosphatase family protein n=1 Tax=Sphingorhabdus lacus TaxID=392610 RepID=A0A6I6LGJ3_9SPHN|nr:inositol monophosphatase family protein [Sphingorhabdus lacus]QGY81433.1 inositol monophosphatase family protein [Sphingorhabdus lacus]HPV67640.1 inositol monophosphatase family protein [Sphingorhabdus lacus]
MTPADILLANRLADAAGEAIRPFFRSGFTHEAKEDSSPVTEADRAAEAAIRRILDAECPRDGIIGEEYGEKAGTSGRTWVIDPIDGTVSFMAGRPIFGSLLALLEENWPVLGVIDQCINRERWVGATGYPTTLNGSAVKTRTCRSLSDATLATSGPQYFTQHDGEHFMALAAKTAHKRMLFGGDCYNYALLASGHIDIVVEAGLKLHDFAALVPVIIGSGGMMSDWSGEPLHADSSGHVIAVGDPARLEDVLEAVQCDH